MKFKLMLCAFILAIVSVNGNATFAQCNPPCGELWTVVNNTPIDGKIALEYPCLTPSTKEIIVLANS